VSEADITIWLHDWDGPPLSRRAIKALIAGGIKTEAGLLMAIRQNRLKWLPGCGHKTEVELLKAVGRVPKAR
jgi:hypothetical protein